VGHLLFFGQGGLGRLAMLCWVRVRLRLGVVGLGLD
jgi:hypothetical protein